MLVPHWNRAVMPCSARDDATPWRVAERTPTAVAFAVVATGEATVVE